MAKSDITSVDTQSHYGVIIIGAGVSGLAANVQLKRMLGFTDVMAYTQDDDIGGTWHKNTYPGAACDVPISVYSYSFARSSDFNSQWASHDQILRYLHWVQKKFRLNNIVYKTRVQEARWSAEKGLWTLKIKDLVTGEERIRTANVVISAAGALTEPNMPTWASQPFDGEVFHSARWNHEVDLKGKNVVLVGNGCSAAQIVPEIVDEVASLTQVARSRQAVIRRPAAPDGAIFWKLANYIPGLLYVIRFLIFMVMETFFIISDIEKGAKKRAKTVKQMNQYIEETAPKKYWDALQPDFDIAAKRRIYDSGYYLAMNNPKFELVHDDTVNALSGDHITTENGRSIKADVVVLCTGFKVQDFLFPLKVYNDSGETMLHRLKSTNARMYRGTCVADFPNFFVLMGPNTATGHSSVIFTSEAQITMILKLIKPILKDQTEQKAIVPAASVSVKPEVERNYFEKIRAEMKKKVWEKDGGVSWYVDQDTGLCTTLYPYSQLHFWWHSRSPKEKNFLRR